MKKKMIANIVMAAIIVVIAAAGILTVGHIQGWFDADDGSAALLTQLRGSITMERDGVAYAPDGGTVLRPGDKIATSSGATAAIEIGDGYLTLGENTEIVIGEAGSAQFSAAVDGGEVFVNASAALAFDGRTAAFRDSAALLSVRSGSQSVSVFAGTVEDASAGQILEWTGGEASVSDLRITALNDFAIAQIRLANDGKALCFSNEDLDTLVAQREEALQAMLNATEPEDAAASAGAKNTCTITIRCDTIADNMDNLDPAKAGYVPASGCILSTKTVEFSEGETVFDVLKRVCSAYGIQLEYSWTPLYDSYYIEGINNLYEFDCGSESGWMYEVNGWFPNYGCSAYPLKDGDSIAWYYTCVGLGADLDA